MVWSDFKLSPKLRKNSVWGFFGHPFRGLWAARLPASQTPASRPPASRIPASWPPASWTPASWPPASWTPASFGSQVSESWVVGSWVSESWVVESWVSESWVVGVPVAETAVECGRISRTLPLRKTRDDLLYFAAAEKQGRSPVLCLCGRAAVIV